MQLAVLDIVARRAIRRPGDGAAGYDPAAFEIRLQDGGWVPFPMPDDAGWQSSWAALMLGDARAGRHLGERLADRLEAAGWSACAPRLVRAIGAGQPVRVRVRAPDPALLALPWEWLPLTTGGEPLVTWPAITVQRAWDGAAAAPQAALAARASRRGTDRVLLATGGEPSASDGVAAALMRASRAGGRPLEPARDRLDRTSAGQLDRHLRAEAQHQRPVAVLHLQAAALADGALALAADPSPLGPDALRSLLVGHAGTLRLVVIVPTCGAPGADTTALGLAAHRAGIEAVASSRWPLSPGGAEILADHFHRATLAGSLSVEDALQQARQALQQAGLAGDAAGLYFCAHATAEHRPLAPRPWPGLLPYAAHQAPFFAGRQGEVDRVVEAIERLEADGRRRLLVLSGVRGSGLRSLVAAGVAPRLIEERGGRVVRVRAGAPIPAATGPRVLCIDDVPTLLSDGDPGRLVQALWVAASEPETIVLIPIPSEVLGRCGELAIDAVGTRLDTVTTDERHHLMLRAPGPRALQQMVEGPARAVGLRVEDGLSVRIAAELADLRQPLPRLSALLTGMWERRDGDTLTCEGYAALGGAAGAIATRADAALEGLSDDARVAVQAVAVALSGDGRAPLPTFAPAALVDRTRLDAGAVDRALAVLEDHGLAARAARGERVALASIALVDQWPRLQRWRASAQTPSAPAPVQPRAGLGRGWLVAAAALLATVVVGLGSAWAGRERAQDFLGHAVEDPLRDPTVAAIQLRQIRSPADPVAWSSAARLVLEQPLAAAVLGPYDAPVADVRFRADGRAALARAGDRLHLIDPATGTSRPVPIDAPVLAGTLSPDGPALLAIDRQGVLWRWDPSAAPEVLHRTDDPGPIVAAFSPSGDTALVASPARWTLLDPRGVKLATGPMPLDGEVPRVAVVADGGVRHVVAGQTGSVLFWSADQPEPSRVRHPGVRRLQLNAKATHLLSLGDGRLRITDLVRGAGVSRTPSTVRVDAAAFDAEGSWLAVDYTERAEDVHRARRLRVDQRSDQHESEPLDEPAVSLVVGPEAGLVHRGLANGDIESRDLRTGAVVRRLRGHQGRVHWMAASPDGRWLASAAGDGALRMWSLTDPPPGASADADADGLRAALWTATAACAGLADASPEAWCACERCNGRAPAACADVPGGLQGLIARVTPDDVCGP